ncbi:ATP-grasp domain-containing protein [Hyaloraphidium curvatum]|nr:ATP-grasp domain-containing protein [Hyaloraphidium curvatum]
MPTSRKLPIVSSTAAEAASTNANPDALAAPFCERPVKNVVFISPHFPPHFVNFCRALREKGVNVLGIGDTPFEGLEEELRDNLTDYSFVPSMFDYESMMKACGYFVWKYGRIDRIDSLNETWLEVEARLRSDFRVPGLQPDDIDRGRSKFGMHKIFKDAGIPHPDCILVSSASAGQVKQFAAKVGYPLVLKPNIGVGSRGTFKVHNDQEVDRAFAEQPLEDYVAQPFISGTVVTWDGLVDRHGKILFHVSHEYSHGCMEVLLERQDMTMFTLLETSPVLDDYGARAVKALNLRERFFHLEFFSLKSGDYVILEANLRCPGVLMLHQINWTNDIDVFRGWAKCLMGEEVPELEKSRPRRIVAHIARRLRGADAREYAIDNAQLISMLGEKLIHYQTLPLIWEGGMGSDAFITGHQTYEDLRSTIELVQETKEDARRKASRQLKREQTARDMEVDSTSPVSATSVSTLTVGSCERRTTRSSSKRSILQAFENESSSESISYPIRS